MKNLGKWISHNQGVALSLILIVGVSIWTFGCEAKVESLVTPGKKVNASELAVEIDFEVARLNLEIEKLIAQGNLLAADLQRMEEIKQKVINFAAITLDAGTVNPAGVVGLLFSVLGIGAVIDNRIKDKVIKNRPLKVT